MFAPRARELARDGSHTGKAERLRAGRSHFEAEQGRRATW